MADGFARLREALAPRRLKALGISIGMGYALLYLYALGHVAITPGRAAVPMDGVFRFVGFQNFWRERAPYNYEPVAILQPVEGFAVFFAIPNVVLAVTLGALVSLNVVLFVHAYLHYRHCGFARSAFGLAASLPAFLTGFACCAPSFVVLLGAVSAAAFVPFLEVVMPVAIGALFLSLGWNLFRPLSGTTVSRAEAVEEPGAP
jgi:hypothetical protein